MSDLLKKDKTYWRIAASMHSVEDKLSFNVKYAGDIFRSAYIGHCFNISYNEQKIKLFNASNMGDLNLLSVSN